MAVFEYTHYLHCLVSILIGTYTYLAEGTTSSVLVLNANSVFGTKNKLRQHIYPEYYGNHSFIPHRTHERTVKHLDHCIDMLRQKIMCDADISVITYNWYDDSDYPIAKFDTQHKCRDFNALQDWARERRAKTSDGRVYKPDDAVILPS